MLDDLKLICYSYITYNFDNFSHRYRYKKLKANVNKAKNKLIRSKNEKIGTP